MAWMLGGGGGYTGLNGSYEIDSQKNINSLNWVKDNLVKTGLTGPVPPERLNRKDAYAAFVRGEVGKVNGHPSLLQPARAAGIEVGKVPVLGRDGTSHAAPAVVDWIMAFKRSGHPQEFGSFLDVLFSDENVRAFAARNNLLPVTVSVNRQMAADDRHRDLREFLHELPTSVLPPRGQDLVGRRAREHQKVAPWDVFDGPDMRVVHGPVARSNASTRRNSVSRAAWTARRRIRPGPAAAARLSRRSSRRSWLGHRARQRRFAVDGRRQKFA
ncbi:hypothetical protein [Streptomyces sp. LMG1-1-1.1]|uniref:hypothetical protein n=1 Tax=Streptomyces sp. LMG1-1-1.1 TaxID=3135245 RepID=UPI0034B94344